MMFDSLGLSTQDTFLLITCPLLAAIVAWARAASTLNPLDSPPTDEKFKFSYRKMDWTAGWFIFGGLSGLLVALLFIGAIKEDVGALGRVLVIAMLSGYLGPHLWNKQEKIIVNLIDKKLREFSFSHPEEANSKNQTDT